MDLIFEIAGNQIDGARDYQEDAFLTTFLNDESGGSKSSALVVVADGMGGHAAGNIASNMVVSTFNKSFTSIYSNEDAPAALRDSLAKANGALSASIRETPALEGMGCTMIAAYMSKGRVWWVSVGDSHLYLLRDRELLKKNDDHSYGGYLDRMKAQGVEVSPEPGLSRNMLVSAMTGEDIVEIDCPSEPAQLLPGDRMVLASDGMDTIGSGTVIQLSAWAKTPKECVDALLKAVEDAERPRQDNTTVVVIDVVDRAADRAAVAAAPEEAATTPSLGDTQPIDLDEEELGSPTMERVAASAASDAPATLDAAEASEPKAASPRRRKGGLIGIALAAIIVIASGALFLLDGDGKLFGIVPQLKARFTDFLAPSPPAPTVETPEAASPPESAEPKPKPIEPVLEPPEPAVAESPSAAPPKEFQDRLAGGGLGPSMVEIPGGSFEMGSTGLSINADERPQHTVTIKPFAISKHEVTGAEYERFTRATGRRTPDTMQQDKKTHPVVNMSWADAVAYARWLSKQTGKTYRLPSESEWEYAASAGTTTPYWWGFEVGTNKAHCFGCETGLDARKPTEIGRFEPNSFGLYDSAGNVAEWVRDCYGPNYQDAPADGSARVNDGCSHRVGRGGSYSSPPPSIRSQKRAKLRPESGYDMVGIRVARDL